MWTERLPLGPPLIVAEALPLNAPLRGRRLWSEVTVGCDGIVRELVGGGDGANTRQKTTPAFDLTCVTHSVPEGYSVTLIGKIS